MDDLETLKSMLNAYASKIGSDELETILEKAQALFYREKERLGLFFDWNIEKRIDSEHGRFLRERPTPKTSYGYIDALLFSVGPTTFVEKVDRNLTFATYLEFFLIDYDQVLTDQAGFAPGQYYFTGSTAGTPEPFRSSTGSTGVDLTSRGGVFGGPGFGYPGNLYTASGLVDVTTPGFGVIDGGLANLNSGGTMGSVYPGRQPMFVPRRRGRKVFEVKWHAVLTSDGELTEAALDGLKPHSAEWFHST